jgi:hypothetical protein
MRSDADEQNYFIGHCESPANWMRVRKSAAGDEADEESDAEGTQHAFRGVLADVIFGGRVKLLGFHASFLPVFGG